jgi:hypothetical protein
MTIKHAYAADILKAERNENGDLVVFGKATGPDLDLDKQICDPAWLKTAMPAWMQWGNIREQHSAIAAGVATDLEQDGDSWMVRSLVIDPASARKVETGVLKGYSIGIKNPRVVKDASAPGGRIVGGEIVELSLVDRPCNPTCTLVVGKSATPGMKVTAGDFDEATGLVRVEELRESPDAADATKSADTEPAATDEADTGTAKAADTEPAADAPAVDAPAPAEVLTSEKLAALLDTVVEAALAKRDRTATQREEAAADGAAMNDGSFPIKTVADLRNAIKAVGRAKNPATARRHITQRAKALGREDLLPDTWKGIDPDTIKADGPWTHDPAQLAAVRDSLIALLKAELDEFAAGDDERCDIYQLMRTLSLYLDWWDHEAAMGETSAPFGGDTTGSMAGQTAYIDLAAEPTGGDTSKTATPVPAAAPSLDETRINELIAAAMTKANDASKERIAALEAELAKVSATPIPGGPVLTRTAADTNRAAAQDELLVKAANYRRLADEVTDPQAKTGYWQLAAQLEQKASTSNS